jgi:hypothetical protein
MFACGLSSSLARPHPIRPSVSWVRLAPSWAPHGLPGFFLRCRTWQVADNALPLKFGLPPSRHRRITLLELFQVFPGGLVGVEEVPDDQRLSTAARRLAEVQRVFRYPRWSCRKSPMEILQIFPSRSNRTLCTPAYQTLAGDLVGRLAPTGLQNLSGTCINMDMSGRDCSTWMGLC